MSAVTASARDRRTEVRRLIDSMEHAKVISDGHFSALGMLITDASLSADEPALVECQDGLQWLHRHYLDVTGLDGAQREQRGRILGLIDVVHWALRRLPSGLQLGLRPESHAARFLVAVHRRQGMSNKQLAAALGTDETEVSRVGRRLLSAGLVWRRKEWRHNAWDITPRGFQYLETSGLLAGGAGDGRRAAGPGRGEELAPRSPDAVPHRPRQDAPEPDRAEAGLPEPGFTEHDRAEPGHADPGHTDPGHAEPGREDSGREDSGRDEPGPPSSPGHA